MTTFSWASSFGLSKRGARACGSFGGRMIQTRGEVNMVQARQYCRLPRLGLALSGLLILIGCYNTPIDVSDFSRGPAPLRMPSPSKDGNCCYEDSLEGGHIFEMYCSACHNARPLAERPFSNYQNVAQHMRVRADLTGKEYAKLVAWLRRWHDVPPADQREGSSPKRFVFGQPIPELRQDPARTAAAPVSGPRAGATNEASPGQPPPGNSP